jgi:(E)-4-hydroxy-3-methylbut-2-enyl-diphosphate synthase
MQAYCSSRFVSIRRKTREVKVGNVGVGGANPIRIQSMTTTLTTDIQATVKQTRVLVEAGCEMVRITAPNTKAAQALGDISRQLRLDKIDVPLIADIHFLPSAAMEAVEHVEKVRVNPGNYADKKKFSVREYSDKEYKLELERLHEAFTPLVLRSKELGRSMRIGTNHGSLSDRIMNRFGDSPMGMVESALEFIRIAESHDYKDIILSMKASNPKVMIQAYRMLVAQMNEEGMDYPLHLGVTEAGDGEDGRIKSAIGIGSLLMDGLGDTIRVSLTEDPVYEIPVAAALAEKTSKLWLPLSHETLDAHESIDPYSFRRREIRPVHLSETLVVASNQAPRVFIKSPRALTIASSLLDLQKLRGQNALKDTPLEGWILQINHQQDIDEIAQHYQMCESSVCLLLDLAPELSSDPNLLEKLLEGKIPFIPSIKWSHLSSEEFSKWNTWCADNGITMALGISSNQMAHSSQLFLGDLPQLIIWAENGDSEAHTLGEYRLLISIMESIGIKAPLWIRCLEPSFIQMQPGFLNDLLEVSLISGGLLSDGLGDILSVETVDDPRKALSLAYNSLQGAGARISKTEYVACPSCGRTLFDLQQTTQKIRQATNHLKGVKIAVMGCIVNGPGEMADADFGYVGGAPAKVNLYVGKDCVEYHVNESEAVDRLIDLIRHEGKWVDPS